MILDASVERWAAESAARAGIPLSLLRGLIWVESRGRVNALSPVGAIGLTQLMPATALELGVDPLDPAQNVAGGAEYLRRKLRELEGDVAAAVAAYNAGAGRVRQRGWPAPGWLARMPAETRDYVPAVLEAAGWSLRGELAIPPRGEAVPSADAGDTGELPPIVIGLVFVVALALAIAATRA